MEGVGGRLYFGALHQALESQYQPCDCEACKSSPLTLSGGKGEKNTLLERMENILQTTRKAFNTLYKQKAYKPEDLLKVPEFRAVVEEMSDIFSTAIPHETPAEMKAYLEKDAFVFSGLKTHAQLAEARSYLKDENGNIRPYYQFERDILKLNETYNKNYLEAEYQFAVYSSQSAANWANLQDNTDRYSLEYRTAGDERVRASHAALNGICLPKNDPFWQEFYPPNGWRCRCIAVEVLSKDKQLSDPKKAKLEGEKATTQISKTGKNKLEMFRFNPGVEKKMFPPKNSYTKVAGAELMKKALESTKPLYKDTSQYDTDIFKLFNVNEEKFAVSKWHKRALKINEEMRPAETLSINKYTDTFFHRINTYLRNKKGNIDIYEKYIEVTNSGLDKLPSYKGTVYRGSDLPPEVINKYKKAAETGEPYTENYYLSTSKERESAFDKNTMYQIKSKKWQTN